MKRKSLTRMLSMAAAFFTMALNGAASVEKDIVIENVRFKLTIGGNAIVKSLVSKANGEELLSHRDPVAFCSVTQLRPFNNEIKLAYQNVRTTYQANRIRREGDNLIVGFEIAPYDAVIGIKVTGDYVAFELKDFILTEKSYPLCFIPYIPSALWRSR